MWDAHPTVGHFGMSKSENEL